MRMVNPKFYPSQKKYFRWLCLLWTFCMSGAQKYRGKESWQRSLGNTEMSNPGGERSEIQRREIMLKGARKHRDKKSWQMALGNTETGNPGRGRSVIQRREILTESARKYRENKSWQKSEFLIKTHYAIRFLFYTLV